MIRCHKCHYSVPSSLRFCLMKNMCPSCGGALMTESQIMEINKVKGKIMAQDFAQSLAASVVYDMALFIIDEFQATTTKSSIKNEVEVGADTVETEEEFSAEQPQKHRIKPIMVDDDIGEDPISYEDEELRKEIEQEFAEEIAAMQPQHEDELRMAKLKRQAEDGKGIIQTATKRIKSSPTRALSDAVAGGKNEPGELTNSQMSVVDEYLENKKMFKKQPKSAPPFRRSEG